MVQVAQGWGSFGLVPSVSEAFTCWSGWGWCATFQFRAFYEEGRAVRTVLPLGCGPCVHLVVGYQASSHDLEARAKTGLLFDAVMGGLAPVAGCQTRLIVGDFDVEPNLILCLSKVIGSGLWVDFEDAWSAAAGKTLGVTCKRFLGSAAGSKRGFVVAGPLAAASLSSCDVVLERWIQPLFAVRVIFSAERWSHLVCRPVSYTRIWPACWFPAVDKGRSSKSVDVLRVWEVCDEYLKCMPEENCRVLRQAMGGRSVYRVLIEALCALRWSCSCQGFLFSKVQRGLY